MNQEAISQLLTNIVQQIPELKRQSGKTYAHARTDPGALLSVHAMRDRVRVSFITSGRGSDIDSKKFLEWANESKILSEDAVTGLCFAIREGAKNKEKREVYCDIIYENQSESEVITRTMLAYRTLLEKLNESFHVKSQNASEIKTDNLTAELDAYEVYQILIADIDSDAILANIVYAEVGQEIWGCYSGYAGGGVIDYRFFHFDADYDPTVDDDYYSFPISETQNPDEVFPRLESIRKNMESDDPDALVLSEAGRGFLDRGDVDHSSGIRISFSIDASEDIIYDIQDEWTLLFQLR